MVKCRAILSHKNDNRSFDYYDLVLLNSVYEELYNIIELSKYILFYLVNYEEKTFPILLHGFNSGEMPNDEQLLLDLLNN